MRQAGVRCIRFERMASESEYPAETLGYFGSGDYPPSAGDAGRGSRPKPVGAVKEFAEAGVEYRAAIVGQADWFRQKYC